LCVYAYILAASQIQWRLRYSSQPCITVCCGAGTTSIVCYTVIAYQYKLSYDRRFCKSAGTELKRLIRVTTVYIHIHIHMHIDIELTLIDSDSLRTRSGEIAPKMDWIATPLGLSRHCCPFTRCHKRFDPVNFLYDKTASAAYPAAIELRSSSGA
jgi:hypothetical protein